MIRLLVDFALRERLLVLGLGLLLLVWGAISFHTLPVEAYPDVADTWVQVITQWYPSTLGPYELPRCLA